MKVVSDVKKTDEKDDMEMEKKEKIKRPGKIGRFEFTEPEGKFVHLFDIGKFEVRSVFIISYHMHDLCLIFFS